MDDMGGALGHHTVVQGPSQGACSKLVGGFYSPSMTSGTFSWTVNGTGPWYYFCAVPGHCVQGMWGVLGVPGMTDTIPSTTALPNSSVVASSTSMAVTSSTTSTIPLTASPVNSSSSAPTSTSNTSAATSIHINWALGMLALFAWAALLA
ncbi:hypothetical protein BC937DRAFT_88691 [Endogone sp. FLAS-F59071]|nr:hypothetical protein BC937DRAFT_88691 [Endogone sp. FLAS-F59071]|eukprot:RUS18507.1 hypothetical protein BC937DRAFT_88691 [Endogone sp. FLAS-F59071]